MEYGKETIFITGVATPPKEAPIIGSSEVFLVSFIVCRETGVVLDMDCNLIYKMPIDFIRPIFIGRSLANDIEHIVMEIRNRYLGLSQKALIVALKDAHNRYLTTRKNAMHQNISRIPS